MKKYDIQKCRTLDIHKKKAADIRKATIDNQSTTRWGKKNNRDSNTKHVKRL